MGNNIDDEDYMDEDVPILMRNADCSSVSCDWSGAVHDCVTVYKAGALGRQAGYYPYCPVCYTRVEIQDYDYTEPLPDDF